MGKIVVGLAAVIGAATPIAAAQAAVVSSEEANQALRASSVAELLQTHSQFGRHFGGARR
jgi:hypothetical protein